MTALERYNEYMKGDVEPDPVERLRFILSLALSGQDWIDVEQFIDGVSQQLTATETRLDGVKQQRDVERASYLNEFEKNQVLIKQLSDSQKRGAMLRDALHDYKWNKDEWGFIKCVTEIIEVLDTT